MWKNRGVNLPREFRHKQNSNAEYNKKKKRFLAAYECTSDANTWRQASILAFSSVVIKRMLCLCLFFPKIKSRILFLNGTAVYVRELLCLSVRIQLLQTSG